MFYRYVDGLALLSPSLLGKKVALFFIDIVNVFVNICAWNGKLHTTAKHYKKKSQIFLLGFKRDTFISRIYGANLGMPHTRAMSNGLFELRMKSNEGIGRVFYCTLIGKRIGMLHSFIKKSQKTPSKELKIAISRMKEVKSNANT